MEQPESNEAEKRASGSLKRAGGLRLNVAECNHLLTLLGVNKREGWYFAPREQYEKRAERIRKKILAQLTSAIGQPDAIKGL